MKKQTNKLAGLQKRKALSGYVFISPFIIGFLVFLVKPLAQSLYMSFCDVQINVNEPKPINMVWAGLMQYKNAFLVDPNFNRNLVEQFTKMLTNSLAIMVFSFFVALILNQEFKGRAFVRAVFFLPVILSSGIILGLESNNSLMAQLQVNIQEAAQGISITGTLENILRTTDIGIGVKAFEIVFQLIDGIYDVAIASGIQIIIFLSGLQTISASMYEAADIEGCTAWESLWKITFPMISSLLLVNWIYTIIDFCMRSDNAVITQIQTEMVTKINYGSASAMSWIYFAIVMAYVGITSFIISKGVYYYD